MTNRCQLLDWDSQFFGCRIARLSGDQLSPDEVPGIDRWCASQSVDCLYFLADCRSPETIAAAEQGGFGFKDLRMTYEWKSSLGAVGLRPQIAERVTVRGHQEKDVEELVAIARRAHTDTRFYFDQRFDRANADLLYETWLRKACAGSAQQVFVGETGGSPAGYLSCHLEGDGAGSIGIVAVDPSFHGQGIGRAMILQALLWFAEQGATDISVVTQGRNVLAHRFYQSAGFLTRAIECWYHKWYR
jgi:ribosomal protein S18 acetylase RimI-like enzyme